MGDRHQVHYEIFARRMPQSGWTLQLAIEDREQAIKAAEEMLKTGAAIAIRVSKETLDSSTGEYRSLTVLEKGEPEQKKKARPVGETTSICSSPQELYTPLARDKISRLLEDWLKRQGVTPFELLHRPDLAERLEATGNELQHVIQKLAVPEAGESGESLHEIMRRWRALIDKAVTRLIADGRKNAFPDIVPSSLLATLDKLSSQPEKAYLFGGALAKVLKPDPRPSAKLEKLLLFANVLAEGLPGREWAMAVLEAPVVEIFAARSSLNDVLGQEVDLGTSMTIMTRMAATREVDLLAARDPTVAKIIPPLKDVLAGYHNLMTIGLFPNLANSISKRLMLELKGPRRLCPGDPEAEIETLRALAMCLTAAGKDDAQRESVSETFIERSKMLISADFVDSLAKVARSPCEEVEKLTWLCENVAGGANKRQAARWLIGTLGGLKFERDIRDVNRPVAQRLTFLAHIQRRAQAAQLPDKDVEDIMVKCGQFGAQIATEVNLIAQTLRNSSPPVHKLAVMLSYASGQMAPIGPVSEQAKAEALRMLRNPGFRQNLLENPQMLAQLKPMMQAAGLAA
jgi:hypothetical protein